MVRVKEGLKDIKTADLVAKSEHIIAQMTGNLFFQSPEPPLSEIHVATDALKQAAEKAFGKDRKQVAIKNMRKKELKSLLSRLASHVQFISREDAEIILSSGFEIRKPKAPIGLLTAPARVRTVFTAMIGAILLKWKPVYGARNYIVEINEGDANDPSSWTYLKPVTKTKLLIENLQTGKIYWLRVRALGAAGLGAPSDPARGLAY